MRKFNIFYHESESDSKKKGIFEKLATYSANQVRRRLMPEINKDRKNQEGTKRRKAGLMEDRSVRHKVDNNVPTLNSSSSNDLSSTIISLGNTDLVASDLSSSYKQVEGVEGVDFATYEREMKEKHKYKSVAKLFSDDVNILKTAQTNIVQMINSNLYSLQQIKVKVNELIQGVKLVSNGNELDGDNHKDLNTRVDGLNLITKTQLDIPDCISDSVQTQLVGQPM